jgi:hypothetical protein
MWKTNGETHSEDDQTNWWPSPQALSNGFEDRIGRRPAIFACLILLNLGTGRSGAVEVHEKSASENGFTTRLQDA